MAATHKACVLEENATQPPLSTAVADPVKLPSAARRTARRAAGRLRTSGLRPPSAGIVASGTVGTASPADVAAPELAAAPFADEFTWNRDEPVGQQSKLLCERLAATGKVYRIPERGVCQLENGKPVKQITDSDDLEAFIRARFPVTVIKSGEVEGRSIPRRELQVLLRSDELQSPLPAVDHVTSVVTYNSKWELTRPGYNGGDAGDRYFYTGGAVTPRPEPVRIREFIGAMCFRGESDATNAVALALTTLLRFKWHGQKPFGAVTANKSHAGKDTVLDFAAGHTKRTEISRSNADWATENAAVAVLRDPEVGVLTLGNIRSSRGISSQFIERTITEKHPKLQSSRISGEGVYRPNDFVITASANQGMFSIDLINRMLPIHLELAGAVTDRKSPIDNPRYGYLPQHRAEIEAELCGMIERWKSQGCPLDADVRHDMKDWARTVGGILKASGFNGFLGNVSETREADDCELEALAIIAHHAPHDVWLRATALADVALPLGVARTLMDADKRETRESRARELGRLFTAHSSETLCWKSAAEPRAFKVRRARTHNGNANAAWHYMFETVNPEQTKSGDTAAE